MTVRQGSPEWLAGRRAYVGASELAAILGEDPYRGEYELALLKRGLAEPEPTNEAQAWGHRVQRLAVEQYAEMTGHRVRNVNITAVSRTHPHVAASLDARHGRTGVEIKLTGARWDGEPPRRVVIQCQGQMGVVGLDAVDVVKVAKGYAAPEVFTVERDDEAIRELLEVGEAWWLRYVGGDELPPVDGSRAAGEYLRGLRGTEERAPTPEQVGLARDYLAVRDQIEVVERMRDQLRNAIKASMAGAGVITGDGIRVVWSEVKGRTVTDWKSVAAGLRGIITAHRDVLPTWGDDELDAFVGMHTSVGDPTDRLDVKEASE